MVKTVKVMTALVLLLAAGLGLPAQTHPDYAWTRFTVDPANGTDRPLARREAALIRSVAPDMAYLNEVVGTCPEGLGKYHPESPLSNWAADMLRSEASRITGIECDLSIMNFGGIRSEMPKGDVLRWDIRGMFPFKNYITVVRLPGERLYSILDSLARNHWQAVSGAEIISSRAEGIQSLKIGGADFDKSRVYNLATIDFLLSGGDDMHLSRGALSCKVTDVQVFDAAMHYLSDLKAQGKNIEAFSDGRIKVTDHRPHKDPGGSRHNKSDSVAPIPSGRNYSLTILHTNDTHSHIEAQRVGRYAGKGGIVGRAALVDSIRRVDGRRNVLLLDAGDFEQGTPYFTIFGGKVEIESMNIMGYDAVTFGNHEWDNGSDDLKRRISKAGFRTLLCNYETSDAGLGKLFKPYAIFRRGGKKIGVVGILTDIGSLVSSNAGVRIKYVNPVGPVNKWAEYLKNEKKCDLVIVLSHCGFSSGNPQNPGDLDIVPLLHNVDIVIGGHSHTDLHAPRWLADADGRQVMIVTDYCHGVYLGEIKL